MFKKFFTVRERERQTERDRETETETETERDRETERHREREDIKRRIFLSLKILCESLHFSRKNRETSEKLNQWILIWLTH